VPAALAATLFSGIFCPTTPAGEAGGGQKHPDTLSWVAVDFHNHTRLTDGTYSAWTVFEKSLGQFGLGCIANSEHGGAFGRDPQGRFWEDPQIQPAVVIKGDLKQDKNKRRLMWRWQSLLEYSYPLIAEARKDPRFTGKVFLQGVELNCPGHEHVSAGIVADSGLPIAEFEYRFDAHDTDISGGPAGAWTRKITTNDHAKALAAVAWLETHHDRRSWFIVNHPERAGKYRIEDLRDFNDAAPEVAFGFEGAPGHQKSDHRGGYAERSYRYGDNDMGGATYGGVGVFVARVGGVWDALLGEGRRFFAFANSDFHNDGGDFFPGEYQKTYVKVSGKLTEQSVLDGVRSGRSFFVSGDLVDARDFTATSGGEAAKMGGHLGMHRGADVRVSIRLHDPPGANCLGDEAVLDHLDLIAGDITGPVEKHPKGSGSANPAYAVDVNPSARVLARFDAGNWHRREDGWLKATFTLNRLERDVYLRLRGTNLPPGTDGETDKEGNPLSDALAHKQGIDGLEEARADLWFYSSPIFIRAR